MMVFRNVRCMIYTRLYRRNVSVLALVHDNLLRCCLPQWTVWKPLSDHCDSEEQGPALRDELLSHLSRHGRHSHHSAW